jgi:hypothetical protein
MVSSTLIYFNKNREEVARVTFDENDVPGWCIKSKAEPSFKRKFAAQREACAVWLREFDPETGKLVRNLKGGNSPALIDLPPE